MSTPPFVVAPLTHDRVAEYVRIHVAMLTVSYAHHLGPEYSANRWAEVAWREDELHRDIEETADADAAGRDPFRRHRVALNPRGGIAGIVSAGVGVEDWEHEVAGDGWVPAASEWILDHLYVVPGIQGAGLGQRLLDVALGRRPAFLWVMEDNRRAEAFYRRNGFVRDGVGGPTGPSWGDHHTFRMQRPAPAASADHPTDRPG